ncbi:MAG: hypothetical protein HXY46_11275 [Syntrophaceae bacterium]|nr:hypothetical protein [Syntrophaceae bacterium]
MMSRFCRYVERVFDFGDRVRRLRDGRQRPRIPASAIWMSVFAMFATQRGSLNAIGSSLQRYMGMNNKSIGELFGGIHYSAVTKASGRLRGEMIRDQRLSKLVDELDSHFKA